MREIDRAVREIVQAAFDRAAVILKERRETLVRGARELLARETLGEEDLNRLRLTMTGLQAAPAQSGG